MAAPTRRRSAEDDRRTYVLFLDLDVVITGSLDEFFDFEPGRFCVAKNWSEPELRVGKQNAGVQHIGAAAALGGPATGRSSHDSHLPSRTRTTSDSVAREVRDQAAGPGAGPFSRRDVGCVCTGSWASRTGSWVLRRQ